MYVFVSLYFHTFLIWILKPTLSCVHVGVHLLVYLWLQRVLMHWGRVSCRVGSITLRLTGSWCTSQLGFLRDIHDIEQENLKKQNKENKKALHFGYVLLIPASE